MNKLLLAFCLLSAGVYSQEKTAMAKSPDENQKTESYEHLIKIGGSYNYIWLTPTGFPNFTGNLGGAQFSYEYNKKDFFYGAALFTYRQGPTTQLTKNRNILDFNVLERFGYTYGGTNFGRDWEGTLFSGLGFRYLQQNLEQPLLSTLIFEYKEFYVPVGFLMSTQVADFLAVGLDFTWMPQVYPALQINPYGGANWILTYRIDNFLIELPFTFTHDSYANFILEIKPTFEYWNDGQTTASTVGGGALFVPSNRYMFLGVQVNLGGRF